jgi:hypothetical protein
MKMKFCSFENSFVIYDAYYELTTLSYKRFSGSDLDVSLDLNGTKNISQIKN